MACARRLMLIGASLACLFVGGCSGNAAPASSNVQPITIAGRSFTLELAVDSASRYQGLSDRAEIPADGGMLFVIPQPRVLGFVMRRCLVPLDIIFLDGGGRITAMHTMAVEPYDTPDGQLTPYSSRWPAQFAIELRAGTLAELDLTVGQRIDLPVQSLKQRAR